MTNIEEPNPIPVQVTLPLVEYTSRAYLLNNRQITRRLSRTLETNPVIRTQIAELGGLDRALTSTPEDPIAAEYSQRFLNLQTGLDLHQFLGNNDGPIPEVQEMASLISNSNKVITDVKSELEGCCQEIKSKLESLDSKIDNKFRLLNKKLESLTKIIIDQTAEEVANRVVGESYYRYCATTTFMPTLILVFKEETENKNPRRSQLKFKLNKNSEDITEEDIKKLKTSFLEVTDHSFDYGTLRCNYVSENKSFKNVLYTKTKKDAELLLKFIYPLLGHHFDEKNLSFTEGRNRAIFNRRKTPLDGVKPFSQDYSRNFKVILYRVVLQVNNLERPVLIYKNY